MLHVKVACVRNTREVFHARVACPMQDFMSRARGACAHARTFQGTGSRQIDSFLVERECRNLQQETMKFASRNNMTAHTLVWDHRSCSDGS